MTVLAVAIAAAVAAALLTWFLAGRRMELDAASSFAVVWREGYLQGVEDERTSAAWDVPGYGPNRVNPYPSADHAAGN